MDFKLSEKYDQITNVYSYTKSKDEQMVKLYSVDPRHNTPQIMNLREAAEVHKLVRKEALSKMKVGVKYLDVCNFVENKIVEYFDKQNDLKKGVGFLLGINNRNIAAHDSATPNDTRTIKKGDMFKLDFGTHVNGFIIDSAFTVSFADKQYAPLLQASKEAMWAGIKAAGSDASIKDVSEVITEVASSYELIINDKSIPISPCIGIGGHNILPYQIHGGKIIMNNMKAFPKDMENVRMKEGETYAIEVFTSDGTGQISVDNSECTHFMLNKNAPIVQFTLDITQKVYGWLKKHRTTLPFSSRWLHSAFGEKYRAGLSELVKKNVVHAYPPLVDNTAKYTAQFEHTIYLHPFGKEVVSQGDDY